MSTVENLANTDLTTAYSKDYFKPGDTYRDADSGGQYVWGVYWHGTGSVTTTGNSVCVPVLSSTNAAIFTADVTDTDLQFQDHVGYSPAQMANKKRGWFKVGGKHIVKECSTTIAGLVKGTMFRVVATDKTIAPCTTRAISAGITLEAFGASAATTSAVWLFNFR